MDFKFPLDMIPLFPAKPGRCGRFVKIKMYAIARVQTVPILCVVANTIQRRNVHSMPQGLSLIFRIRSQIWNYTGRIPVANVQTNLNRLQLAICRSK